MPLEYQRGCEKTLSAWLNQKKGELNMLEAGDKAPDFELPAQDGKNYTLQDFSDSILVLFFYIKDRTPG